MPLYLLTLPTAGLFSVCELTAEDADAIRDRLKAAGAFDEAGDERGALEPLEPDDRATVEALIALWESQRDR